MQLRLNKAEMAEAIGDYIVSKGLAPADPGFVIHFEAIRHRKEADEFFAVIQPKEEQVGDGTSHN